MRRLLLMAGLCTLGCTERTEYRYRPDYVAINQGRPLEETFYRPDGTKVIITSEVPNASPVEPPRPVEPSAAQTDPGADPPPLQVHTPDMVLEAFMGGLRGETYDDLWARLVSPQQKLRMGERGGQANFVKFCQDNRRELMASCLKLCTCVRSGQAVVTPLGEAMTRYELPVSERGNFGFSVLEVERTSQGLRLAGLR